jgi:hypothetical protein
VSPDSDEVGDGTQSRGLGLPSTTHDDLLRTDGGEELTYTCRDAVFREGVIDTVGVPTLDHQSGILQDAQVPGYRRGADCESSGDVARGQFTVSKVLEDLPTSGVG